METGQGKIVKVVVTGPESTGKSTLSRQLAEHFRTAWVPEYAREYLIANGPGYTQDDLWNIAEGQMMLEDSIVSGIQESERIRPVFIDTDLHVIRIWSEYVFGQCDNRILQQIAARTYHFNLLCDTDLPWTPDPLRELPDLVERRRIFHHYHDTMLSHPIPWALVSGHEEERLQKAIDAVNLYMQGIR